MFVVITGSVPFAESEAQSVIQPANQPFLGAPHSHSAGEIPIGGRRLRAERRAWPENLIGEQLTGQVLRRGEENLVVLRPVLHLVLILLVITVLVFDLFAFPPLVRDILVPPRVAQLRLVDSSEAFVMPVFETEKDFLDLRLDALVEVGIDRNLRRPSRVALALRPQPGGFQTCRQFPE